MQPKSIESHLIRRWALFSKIDEIEMYWLNLKYYYGIGILLDD